MINFFRKTRKKLADNNKFLKYSRYAIGEIALVMIGILLALQVNNWNEQNKINKEEQLILKDLRSEISSNIKTLEQVTQYHQKILNDGLKLKEFFDHPDRILDVSNDSLVIWTYQLAGTTYYPEKGILNSIISSGQINIIKNTELKYLIASLEDYTQYSMALTRQSRNIGFELLVKSIYPDAIRRSLEGKEYSYESGISQHFNWKNMYINPDFYVAVIGTFTANREMSIIHEKELKKRYEDIISLISRELNEPLHIQPINQ